ncbi:hypothetical protein [Hydrogenobacter thermophilus]|uniref:hypothetical protein n=1 Tax=Hydrogenobacter thermophilus TaxID=940 RepID=UPI0026EBC684|nr:hypothetical protein [Hydrogenobacter thermophilus]
MLLCLFLISVSLAFFPFTGEDADTLGKGGLQWETQYARFKHYDETVHKDVVLQITGGIKDNMDIALIIPYSFYRYKDGTRNDGFSDVGVFIKHIPVEAGNFKAGYKLQLNFNTGKGGQIVKTNGGWRKQAGLSCTSWWGLLPRYDRHQCRCT